MAEYLRLRRQRYERIRHAVAAMAKSADQAVVDTAPVATNLPLHAAAAEDDAEEWTLLLMELDAAAANPISLPDPA